MADEEELALGGGADALSVMQGVEAREVLELLGHHVGELLGGPRGISAEERAHDLQPLQRLGRVARY